MGTNLGGVEGGAGGREAAEGAGKKVSAPLIISLVLSVGSAAGAVVANLRNSQRIGSSDNGCPASADWRQNLRRQRYQKNRQIFLQRPPHHVPRRVPNLNHARSGESRRRWAQLGPVYLRPGLKNPSVLIMQLYCWDVSHLMGLSIQGCSTRALARPPWPFLECATSNLERTLSLPAITARRRALKRPGRARAVHSLREMDKQKGSSET